jgi:ribonuclease VapC
LIVVDSSAIVAIFYGEPRSGELQARIAAEARCLISAANYVETGQVLANRYRDTPQTMIEAFHAFLTANAIAIAPIDEDSARVALQRASNTAAASAIPHGCTTATASPTPWPR